MAIAWNTRLETGWSWQDAQHKELFARVNQLLEAMQRGDGEASIQDLFRFLGRYVQTHFAAEEKFMREHHYPGYEEHRLEHARFAEEFGKFTASYQPQSGTLVVLKLQTWLSKWLSGHIGGMDQKLAATVAVKA